ncbi:MAG: UDP-N-acetylmuramoyl-tripeptide--D-alanyl-D-alanine ligase [Verrucomicrobiales bacterium]|jgi:UDP-N-acetylmuramoyl-tripeptide--D-alanyl-D-alanine ligase|nr:UDP-N-acetylmuramoyl-tripeptide--D-alanyl-D-alanine ligase [Verrucomicrobiales bacterium]
MPLGTVAELAGGRLASGPAARHALRVTTDTRALRPGDLFVALCGGRFDGHDFVAQAAQQGAVGVLVSRTDSASALPAGCAVIQVEDTLAGLQRLAKNYRRTLTVKIVAVTGSNGKTSTKEFAAAVLGARFKVHKTAGNLNNHIGVPLTVLGIDDTHAYAVVELGMNHPGELAPLVEIARPDIGIITNIGWAHVEAFGGRDEIALEKARVFAALPADGLAVVNGDDELSLTVARPLTAARVVTVGTGADGDYQIVLKNSSPAATEFWFGRTSAGADGVVVALPLAGWHLARNASLAAALGAELGVAWPRIAASLAAVKLPGNRLSVRKFRRGWLLDDTYNASPDSMLAAFATLQNLPGAGFRVALLGSMGELGADSERLHREVGAAAARAGFEILLALGDHAQDLVAGADTESGGKVWAKHFADHQALSAAYARVARADDKILVKGSRSQRMELAVRELERLERSCCIS